MTKGEEDITVERVDLKPEWLDGGNPIGQPELHFYAFFFVVLGMLSIMIFFTTSYLKHLIGLALIAWVSIGLIYKARKEVKKINGWGRIKGRNKKINLPLKRTSSLVERALNGKLLSQVLVEKRIREVFIEKIKDMKSLSEEDLDYLFKNPSTLRKMIDDEIISDFLMNSKRIKTGNVIRKKDEYTLHFETEQAQQSKEKGKAYRKKIEDVIERISRWEGK